MRKTWAEVGPVFRATRWRYIHTVMVITLYIIRIQTVREPYLRPPPHAEKTEGEEWSSPDCWRSSEVRYLITLTMALWAPQTDLLSRPLGSSVLASKTGTNCGTSCKIWARMVATGVCEAVAACVDVRTVSGYRKFRCFCFEDLKREEESLFVFSFWKSRVTVAVAALGYLLSSSAWIMWWGKLKYTSVSYKESMGCLRRWKAGGKSWSVFFWRVEWLLHLRRWFISEDDEEEDVVFVSVVRELCDEESWSKRVVYTALSMVCLRRWNAG